MADQQSSRVLVKRQKSMSLSAIDVLRRSVCRPAAPVPAQEYIAPVDTPRCACGRLLPVFAPEPQQRLNIKEHDEAQVNAGAEEQDEDQVNADIKDQYEAQVDVDMQEQSSSSDEDDVENDGRNAQSFQHWLDEARNDSDDSDNHSFHTCNEETEDETLYQSHPPLPSPNRLTSTYLPFTSHYALSNHLSSARISSHLATATPFFLHSTLQLPSTLCQVLKIRLPTILRRLTPAVLLEHTTNVHPETLLPSVVEAKTMSVYHHVQGLLFFSPNYTSSPVHDLINEFYQGQAKCEIKKVDVDIEDGQGKHQKVAAWAWVSEEHGVEERWTLEEFIGGELGGLAAMVW